ncbi:hypothetical protein Nepgr_011200 [Nepenthes gracilis]|uniref:Uncharacterized protein n=1 Tax=Nepenthes gracilis TaxID=150966 RepID=A0AAD3XM28_NEPGR|nr:hypothetical protein Nepgr_011200 [Nepenthes gracilis]
MILDHQYQWNDIHAVAKEQYISVSQNPIYGTTEASNGDEEDSMICFIEELPEVKQMNFYFIEEHYFSKKKTLTFLPEVVQAVIILKFRRSVVLLQWGNTGLVVSKVPVLYE